MDVHFVSFDVVFNAEFERKFYPLPTLLWWLRSNVANVQVELALFYETDWACQKKCEKICLMSLASFIEGKHN